MGCEEDYYSEEEAEEGERCDDADEVGFVFLGSEEFEEEETGDDCTGEGDACLSVIKAGNREGKGGRIPRKTATDWATIE